MKSIKKAARMLTAILAIIGFVFVILLLIGYRPVLENKISLGVCRT